MASKKLMPLAVLKKHAERVKRNPRAAAVFRKVLGVEKTAKTAKKR